MDRTFIRLNMKKIALFSFSIFVLATFIGCQSEEKSTEENTIASADNTSTTTEISSETTTETQSETDQQESATMNTESMDAEVSPSAEKTTSASGKSSKVEVGNNDSQAVGEMSLERYNNMTGEAEVVTEKVSETISNYDFHEYVALDVFLHRYVSSAGKVNYAGIKSNMSKLNEILGEFESNYPESSWSSKQKLTYWINAYNIYTIKLIADNYPTSSITKITAKPWEKKFIKLGGKTYDLNTIENDIIRKQFNEPRIHFALNCASKSCPVLLNAAYTPEKLYSQLTSQTKRFMKDATKNDFSNPKKIKISQLFDWYKEDFTKNGTVVDFINKYRTEQLDNPKIEYMEYSWDLNN